MSEGDRHLSQRAGVGLGLAAYLLWGAFPLYFAAMAPAGSLEVLAHRVLWSLVACAIGLTVIGLTGRPGWRPVIALARSPRTMALLVVAAIAIGINWGVYIAAVAAGHVIDASLGYFINPLLTVALAVGVLREKLRRLQWVAVGIGACAVVILSVAAGRPPWIALTLACSFGTYGLAKKLLGRLPALTSLSAETLVLGPLAAVALVVLEVSGRGTFTSHPPWHALLLVSTGPVTALPLLLFAAAARRVPLATTGLLQYVTPVLQLAVGVIVLGERMAASRWAGFALIWVALVLLAVDAVRSSNGVRAEARGPHAVTEPA